MADKYQEVLTNHHIPKFLSVALAAMSSRRLDLYNGSIAYGPDLYLPRGSYVVTVKGSLDVYSMNRKPWPGAILGVVPLVYKDDIPRADVAELCLLLGEGEEYTFPMGLQSVYLFNLVYAVVRASLLLRISGAEESIPVRGSGYCRAVLGGG